MPRWVVHLVYNVTHYNAHTQWCALAKKKYHKVGLGRNHLPLLRRTLSPKHIFNNVMNLIEFKLKRVCNLTSHKTPFVKNKRITNSSFSRDVVPLGEHPLGKTMLSSAAQQLTKCVISIILPKCRIGFCAIVGTNRRGDKLRQCFYGIPSDKKDPARRTVWTSAI